MPRFAPFALALLLPISACGAAATPPPRTAADVPDTASAATRGVQTLELPAAVATSASGESAIEAEASPAPAPRDTQPACAPGSPGCAPRAERPRVVLDESLTPTEAGLPAISADGAEIALAMSDPDPERASSSLAVRFVAAADGATRRELTVLDVREALALEDDDPDTATRARIERRVADLDAAFTSGGFTVLRGIPITRDGAEGAHGRGELAVSFDAATRTLTARGGDGRERLRATLAAQTRRCSGREVEQAATPASAWADAARGVLVVRVTFTSAPRCGAAAPEERVFRLDS
jgi:hypothetical protein